MSLHNKKERDDYLSVQYFKILFILHKYLWYCINTDSQTRLLHENVLTHLHVKIEEKIATKEMNNWPPNVYHHTHYHWCLILNIFNSDKRSTRSFTVSRINENDQSTNTCDSHTQKRNKPSFWVHKLTHKWKSKNSVYNRKREYNSA